jgi:hypothetical protein
LLLLLLMRYELGRATAGCFGSGRVESSRLANNVPIGIWQQC